MNADDYLNMINRQIEEAKANMNDSKKKYREDKAKYESLLGFKQNFITWNINLDGGKKQ